ncbi:hypothetical protein OEB99_06520 [Actinotalea sp. M2MS4P-6]|uniref:hypothetical protein n=1 Tax=Actinotalea sp. M2MS4P-6 TaxID=2983762 RepID=UPI0021E4A805|nr:hypothetical protein [Actinotalea sp. M2MS4P-6]MCV2393955.1 hypothetical protein [Actinotalea sp. M2MS4P-6]
MSLPHRHVFFADDADGDEWSCACGLVAVRQDGEADGQFVVIGAPAFADPLSDADDVLLARALEGLEAIEESAAGRRSA